MPSVPSCSDRLNPILTSSNCCRASTNTTKNETGRPTKADNVEQNYDHFREIHSAVILGVTLMKRAVHRQDSYPDNAGHWQCSVALEVLLTRVSARLRKEPTSTFGKSQPHPCQYQSRPVSHPGYGDVLNVRKYLVVACGPRPLRQIHGSANYPVMFRGAADRCWVRYTSRSLNGDAGVSTREPGKLG